MTPGILTMRASQPGSMIEALRQMVAPALAMMSEFFKHDSSLMGDSAVDEVQPAPCSEIMNYQEQSTAVYEPIANALMNISKKREGSPEKGARNLFLWSAAPSIVHSERLYRAWKSVFTADTLEEDTSHVLLSETDEDSLLLIRHAFGPLADNVVFGLTGSQILMFYLGRYVCALLEVRADDANANSKIAETLTTVRRIWVDTEQSNRRLHFRYHAGWQRKKAKTVQDLLATGRNGRVLAKQGDFIVNRDPAIWMKRIASDARSLLESTMSLDSSVDWRSWRDGLNSQLVNRWCQKYLHGHSTFDLIFEEGTARQQKWNGVTTISWGKTPFRREEFIDHICEQLRSRSQLKPKAPGVSFSLRIRSCNPKDYAGNYAGNKVMTLGHDRNDASERWMVMNRISPEGDSPMLVFPARIFHAAFSLVLLGEDF